MTRLVPLLWIATVALASTAYAEPTKVALAIEGDSSAKGLRKAVVNAFGAEDDVQFVSAQKMTRAIEQLGIGEVHTPRDARSVAKKLAVAAVVQGEFDESDQTLTLIVYANGGQKAGSFTVDADDTKSNDFKKSLRKKMFAKLDVAAAETTTADESTGEDVRKTKKSKGSETKADKKSGKNDKTDKKHGDDDEDVADDKSDKKPGKSSDKADKKHGDDEDVADEKADKKSGKSSDKKSGKSSDKDIAADKKTADKADKKHHDDEDVADEKADKKSGKSSDKDMAADKKGGKGSDKADKKHGSDDEDIAEDTSDKKSGKSSDKADKKNGKSDKNMAADKADKKRGHDDEDIADEKADNKSGKSSDKKHGSDDEDVADEKTDKKSGKSSDKDIAADKKGDKADKTRSDDEDADDDSDEDVAADSDEEDPTSAHAGIQLGGSVGSGVAMRNRAAMRVDLGASMMGRSLRFQSSAVDGAPAGYHTKPVPGGHVEAELYPLAFKDRMKMIGGLGIGGEYDQVQGLTIPTADGTAAVKVIDRRYSVGVRFRIAFGHRATSPTVTLGAGYGERKFVGGMTTGVPDVDYKMIDPSLMARIPIGSRITMFAGGRGMLMLSAGGITKAEQYGRANAMGATATAGLEVGLASHVALRLAAEGTQVNLKFYGQGTLSAMLDGDPATLDVQKARDRYYGGDATIAITY